MVYTDAIKQQEAMMFMTKKQAQLLLLAAGVLMLLFGLWRGEADTVFSKAIRLCMECVCGNCKPRDIKFCGGRAFF